MPRTPRAQEFQPTGSPNTVALDSPQQGINQAIAGVGGVLQREGDLRNREAVLLEEERQRLRDRTAAIEFKNQVDLADIELQGVLNNPDSTEDDVRAAVQRKRSKLESFHGSNDSLSSEQRELLEIEARHQGDVDAAKTELFITNKLRRDHNHSLKIGAQIAEQKEDFGAAEALTNERTDLSSEEKELLNVTRRNAVSSAKRDAIALQISNAENRDEVLTLQELVKQDEFIDKKDKLALNNQAVSKLRSIDSKNSRLVGQALKSLSQGESLDPQVLEELPDVQRMNVEELQVMTFGGLSEESVEFRKLMSDIRSHRPSFLGTPKIQDSRLVGGEPLSRDRERLVDRIVSGEWTPTAANKLMGKLLDMDALDMSDGEIDVEEKWLDRKITDEERDAMSRIRSAIFVEAGIPPASRAGGLDVDGISIIGKARLDGDLAIQAYEQARDEVFAHLSTHLQSGKSITEFVTDIKERIIDPAVSDSILNNSRYSY